MLKGKELTGKADVRSRLTSFSSGKGYRLVAYWDEGDPELWNGRVIALAPRYGESKKNNLRLSYFLVANGFKVLRFDLSNHVGESDGSMDQFTLPSAVDDLVAAARYADGAFDCEEVILVSLSLSSRCGIRACALESKITRFVSLVGMVNMDRTLKSIYRRDIFGEFLAGAEWESIDILGFEIDAANFHDSLVREGMEDLEGTLEDASKLNAPVLFLNAENDLWVDREEVEQVVGRMPNGQLEWVADASHELGENSSALQFAFSRLLSFCTEGLDQIACDWSPALKTALLQQNKIERKRLHEQIELTVSERDFWGNYLGKFGIIEQAHHYVDYFIRVIELLGPTNPGDLVLDAGCGNGFYGISLARSVRQDSDAVSAAPVHYYGVDLTAQGLGRSYMRHLEDSISGAQATRPLSFSYGKVDFDKLATEGFQSLPLADASVSKICCSLVISYLTRPDALLAEFMRVLKPGGVAIISSMKPECDMTVLYHQSLEMNYSEQNESDAQNLLSAAGGIKTKQDAGVYNFYARNELERIAFDAGFVNIRSFRVFGNQANLIRVEK